MSGLGKRRRTRRAELDEETVDGSEMDLTDPEEPTRMPDPGDPVLGESVRARFRRRNLASGLLGTVLAPRTRAAYGIGRSERTI